MANYSEIKATYVLAPSDNPNNDLRKLYWTLLTDKTIRTLHINAVQASYYGESYKLWETDPTLANMTPAHIKYCDRNEVRAVAHYLNKAALVEFPLTFTFSKESDGTTTISITSLLDAGPQAYPELMDLCDRAIKKAFLSQSPKKISSSEPPTAGGCYVATAVYGSYDCPQVWTLRRYRDYELAETWYGRAFIKTYYAISPTLVKWFGDTEWFKKMWRGRLDSLVGKCKAKGFSDTPYEDRIW